MVCVFTSVQHLEVDFLLFTLILVFVISYLYTMVSNHCNTHPHV